jgi:hypothetical protein
MLRILPWFDVEYFLGGCALARWPIAAIIEGEHYKRNVRFQPCQDLLSWALSATVLAANDVAVAAKRISTLFSTMNLRALLIAADVSVASSGTTYSTTSIRTRLRQHRLLLDKAGRRRGSRQGKHHADPDISVRCADQHQEHECRYKRFILTSHIYLHLQAS